MENIIEDYKVGSSTVVNPWLSIKPNCRKQTAGDWYNILMSTALQGRTVHGSNSSPAVEVLCKAPSYSNADTGIGYIKWDPSLEDKPIIGKDISDQFYTHHQYRGTITSSGNVMAYETGLWEPSTRSRAKSTSLLAAGIHAHGCSIKDAVETVSIIASDQIDEEAVSSAILPASHLKREMTIVSKANHRIFTKGTLQRGIEWDDTNLNLGPYSQSVAFDWGRVTAIARYIAEANVQSCPSFRAYARTYGVPYFVVRDSWAYVSPYDYYLTPDLFSRVRRVDLTKYGIPSIKGAFVDHEDEVVIAVTRSLGDRSFVPDSDTFNAYSKLYREAKTRRNRRTRMKPIHAGDYVNDPATGHSINPETVSVLLEASRIPYEALSEAVATRKYKDPIFRQKVDEYLASVNDGKESLLALDELSKVVFEKGTWLLARALGEHKVREMIASGPRSDELSEVSVNLLLGKLKSDYFGRPTHVESATIFSNKTLIDLRNHTKILVTKAEDVPPMRYITQMSLIGAEMRETANELSELATKAIDLLPTINTRISKIFHDWGVALSGFANDSARQHEANFLITAHALRNLELADCMHETTGFIDGAAPKRSYVYAGLVLLANSYNIEVPNLKKCLYSNALSIAMELDEARVLPFSMIEVVRFVTQIIRLVVGDLIVGLIYEPPSELYNNICASLPLVDSPGYDVSMMEDAEDIAMMESWMNRLDESKEAPVVDLYVQALDSYPNAPMADKYARLSGYKDFREAFTKLGSAVYYLESNDYIITARALAALEKDPDEGASKKRGYSSLI